MATEEKKPDTEHIKQPSASAGSGSKVSQSKQLFGLYRKHFVGEMNISSPFGIPFSSRISEGVVGLDPDPLCCT